LLFFRSHLVVLRSALPMDTPSNAHALPESKEAGDRHGARREHVGTLTNKMA
jgi:hypothetical protein